MLCMIYGLVLPKYFIFFGKIINDIDFNFGFQHIPCLFIEMWFIFVCWSFSQNTAQLTSFRICVCVDSLGFST